MSRFVFKETREISLNDLASEKNPTVNKNRPSSYELFDLSQDDGTPSRKNSFQDEILDDFISTTTKTNVLDMTPDFSSRDPQGTSVGVSSQVNSSIKSTEAKQKVSSSLNNKEISSNSVPRSSFLTKFLDQKRTNLAALVEPPPIELSDDTYLQQFHQNFVDNDKGSSKKQKKEGDPPRNESSEDLLPLNDSNLSHFIVNNEGLLTEDLLSISEVPSSIEGDEDFNRSDESSSEDGEDGGSSPVSKSVTINLYNLPYEITSDQVSYAGISLPLLFSNFSSRWICSN
jgi:hypothetical protein